jgi:hypothetical protein
MSKKCCKCDKEFETPGIQCKECRNNNVTTESQRIRLLLEPRILNPVSLVESLILIRRNPKC